MLLRRENPDTSDIRLALGDWKTLGKKLIPAFVQHRDNASLALIVVKLFARLTMPILTTLPHFQRRLEHLQVLISWLVTSHGPCISHDLLVFLLTIVV
jgi:hypothetical protein